MDQGAEFLITEEVAEISRVSIATVHDWRYRGVGPQGFRVGKRVLYRRRDVEAWLDGRRRAAQRVS